MQYILSEEEYRSLVNKATDSNRVDQSELQKLCTLAANHVPVNRPWRPEDKSPWGCIITDPGLVYCDKCPASDLCPYPDKEWSK